MDGYYAAMWMPCVLRELLEIPKDEEVLGLENAG